MRSLFAAAVLATLSLVPAQADVARVTLASTTVPASVLRTGEGQGGYALQHLSPGQSDRYSAFAGQVAPGLAGGFSFLRGADYPLPSLRADKEKPEAEPLSCNRALGECTYIIRTPDGVRIMRTRIANSTVEGLKFSAASGHVFGPAYLDW